MLVVAPAADRSDVSSMDYRLAELGRASGRGRLALGEMLLRSSHFDGPAKLGFSSIGAYGRERLGRSKRWCEDSCSLARKLQRLPGLREALATGRAGWSMVELLARYANTSNERQLLAAAEGRTVRAMRAELRAEAEADGESHDRTTLELSVPAAHVELFEATKILLGNGLGVRTHDEQIEALLAEGSVTLSALEPDAATPLAPPDDAVSQRRRDRADRDAALADPQRRSLAEAGLDLRRRVSLEPLPSWASLPCDVRVLDEMLEDYGRDFSTRELELGLLSRWFFGAQGWQKLGYQDAEQYARERISCTYRTLQQKMRLARGVEVMHELEEAFFEGTVGFESALLIVKHLATRPEYVDDWIARAQQRTVVDLRHDLEVSKSLVRLHGNRRYLAPPTEAQVASHARARADVLSGRSFAKTETTGVGGAAGGSPSRAGFQVVGLETKMSGEARQAPPQGGQPRKLRLNMDAEPGRWWRSLRRHWRACHADVGTSFPEFLCSATITAWLPMVRDAQRIKYADVLARDGYVCCNPTCDRRDVTAHHVVFRSHGGGDEDGNVVALCSACHLRLLHDRGALRVEGQAPELTWLIGRVPHTEVRGRTRLPSDDAGGVGSGPRRR